MHTCRFCGKQETSTMVKYAARHWAHYSCWFHEKIWELVGKPTQESLTEFFATRLHDWQIHQFPVFTFSDWIAHQGLRPAGRKSVDLAMDVLQGAAARNMEVLTGDSLKG